MSTPIYKKVAFNYTFCYYLIEGDIKIIDLYKNIKRERIEKGMSQEELARKVGYADKTMISRIENGKIDLTQSKIEEFAKVFGVTAGYLMGWDVPRTDTLMEIEENTSEAKELFERYKNAIPEIQKAVDSLLGNHEQDS